MRVGCQNSIIPGSGFCLLTLSGKTRLSTYLSNIPVVQNSAPYFRGIIKALFLKKRLGIKKADS